MKYAQIEREALAIKFAVKKFYQHVYGREFVLVTDAKPKVYGPKRPAITLHSCNPVTDKPTDRTNQ